MFRAGFANIYVSHRGHNPRNSHGQPVWNVHPASQPVSPFNHLHTHPADLSYQTSACHLFCATSASIENWTSTIPTIDSASCQTEELKNRVAPLYDIMHPCFTRFLDDPACVQHPVGNDNGNCSDPDDIPLQSGPPTSPEPTYLELSEEVEEDFYSVSASPSPEFGSTLNATAMEFSPTISELDPAPWTPLVYPFITTTDPLVAATTYEVDPALDLVGGFKFGAKITFLVFGKLTITGMRPDLGEENHRISILKLSAKTREFVEQNRLAEDDRLFSLSSPSKYERERQDQRLTNVSAYCEGDLKYDFGSADFSQEKKPMVLDRCELVFLVYGERD